VFVSFSKDFREKLDIRFDRILLVIHTKKGIKIIKKGRRKEKKKERKKKGRTDWLRRCIQEFTTKI